MKKDGAAAGVGVPPKRSINSLLSTKKEGGAEAAAIRDSPMGGPSGSGSDVEESKKKGKASAGMGMGMEMGMGTLEEEGEGGEPGEGEGEERAGQKRKRYITVVEGGKKRKVVDIVSVFRFVRWGCTDVVW